MADVRDFIYLDQRRVLSFGSQLLGGLADTIITKEKTEKNSVKNIDVKGKISGGAKIGEESLALIQTLISWIGQANIEISGELNPQFSSKKINNNERTQSKLLDHFQFSLLHNALVEQNLLKNLDNYKPHEWSKGKVSKDLKPGDFIEITSRVRIFDVSHLEGIATGLEKFVEVLGQISASEKVNTMIKNGTNPDEAFEYLNENAIEIGYNGLLSAFGNDTNPLELNAMIDLMKDIANGGFAKVPMHVIARPVVASSKDTSFVAPIRTEHLLDNKDELIFKYGHEPEQDWKVLGQICKIPKIKSNNNFNFKTPDFSNANKINEFIKEVTNIFTEIGSQVGIQSFVEHPNISINLIALYR
ncbi:DUF6414 family protein [Halanaerobium kushneri]|uniref:Uncharacterized protein n=1 Tax=Halanaerobium kushneri TaxID=56779 RepID=A0A1N6PGH0_9FIRM|nr:hypothetical protein [Halanaerobium kushneri]SIQ03435.1 hypothetical protein SAMN05421834_10182 [Halanaerobium kushneri]